MRAKDVVEVLTTEAIRGFSEAGIGKDICVSFPDLDSIEHNFSGCQLFRQLADMFIDHALINLGMKLVEVEEHHTPPDAACWQCATGRQPLRLVVEDRDRAAFCLNRR